MPGVGDVQGTSIYMVNPNGDTPGVMVAVIRLKPGMNAQTRDAILTGMNRQMSGRGNTNMTAPTDTTWLGRPAKQIVIEEKGVAVAKKGGGLMRYVVMDDAIFFGMIGNDNGRVSAEIENGFFDNFELLK